MSKIIINDKVVEEFEFRGNQHKKIGWFTKQYRAVVKFLKWFWMWTKVLGVTAILVACFAEGYRIYMQDDIVNHAEARQESKDRLEVKVEQLKWNLIEDLIKYESPKGTPLLIVDAPKGSYKCAEDKYSFGKLMFKPCTVTGVYKLYYNKTINREEAIAIAINEEKSKEMAYDMIFNTKKGDKGKEHWHNSFLKNGGDLTRQLKLIKDLEQ